MKITGTGDQRITTITSQLPPLSTGFLNIIVPAGCVECTLSASVWTPQLVTRKVFRGVKSESKKLELHPYKKNNNRSWWHIVTLCFFLLQNCITWTTQNRSSSRQSESVVPLLEFLHLLIDVGMSQKLQCHESFSGGFKPGFSLVNQATHRYVCSFSLGHLRNQSWPLRLMQSFSIVGILNGGEMPNILEYHFFLLWIGRSSEG